MMVKGTSHLFVAGPVVVNQLGAETVDKETLGGSRIHTRNGAVDDEVDDRGRGVRARPPVPLLPADARWRSSRPARPVDDDPERRDETLLDAIPRERREGLQGAGDHRCGRRPRLVLRDSAGTGDAPRSPAWPGSTAGPSRCSPTIRTHYARRLDRGRVAQGRAVRRPRRDLPAARRAPRRQPRLPHRHRRRSGGHDPARRPGARRGLPGDGAVVLGAAAQGLRRRRRRASGRVPASRTGSRGRRANGDRSRSRAASKPRTGRSSKRPTTRPRCEPRSRPGSPVPATRSRPPRRS